MILFEKYKIILIFLFFSFYVKDAGFENLTTSMNSLFDINELLLETIRSSLDIVPT